MESVIELLAERLAFGVLKHQIKMKVKVKGLVLHQLLLFKVTLTHWTLLHNQLCQRLG